MAISRQRRVVRKLRTETVERRAVQTEVERELLLTAATKVFGARGYYEASMRDIASDAGFSIGALYQRFESKDQMYCEVVQKHFAAIWGALDRAIDPRLDFRAQLVTLTATIFEHNTAHRAFLRLYGIHPPTIAEPYQSRIVEMQQQERSRRALVDTLKRGRRERLLASDDVEFLGSMYWAMVLRAVNEFLAGRQALADPDRLATLFLAGAGRAPEQHKAARLRRSRKEVAARASRAIAV